MIVQYVDEFAHEKKVGIPIQKFEIFFTVTITMRVIKESEGEL